MTNKTIQKNVQNKFLFDPSLYENGINISVDEGIVILSGKVNRFYDKYCAEENAKKVNGVKGVVNEIQIELNSNMTISDQDLALAAVHSLQWDVSLPKDKIQVSVQDGKVTLTGEVEHQYQKERAYEKIHTLCGVKGVSNFISVKPVIRVENISHAIEEEFKRNSLLHAKCIHVKTEGGKVTLEGKVKNWSEIDEAIHAAYSVPGVESVINKLLLVQ